MTNNTLLIPETVAPEVLVLTRSSGRVPTLHIPDPEGGPLCSSPQRAAKKTTGGLAPNEESLERCYRSKPLGVYPEPFRNWCGKCCQIVVREGPDVLPDRPLDPKHREQAAKYRNGNALPSKMVYVRSNRGTARRVYHTNRNCKHLQQATEVYEKALDSLPDSIDECRVCSGEADASGGSRDHLASLKAAAKEGES